MDPTTEQVVAALSTPAPDDANSLSRRGFIQAAAVTGALAGIPTWMLLENADIVQAAAAAPPAGEADGIVVSITMGGGNDYLNTLIPINDGVYYDKRPRLAYRPEDALVLGDAHALNPHLTTLKQRWDAGQVAFIEGVGQPVDDLSHFTSMARLMSGQINGVPTSGWLGRYLDDLPGSVPIPGVTVSSSIPLHMLGRKPRTTALPKNRSGLFNVSGNAVDQRQYAVLRSFAGNDQLGPWGSALGGSAASGLDLAGQLRPLYPDKGAEGTLARRMQIIARLINAGLGTRVFSVLWGSFDSHSGQPQQHTDRMTEFDEGLRVFYENLDPAWNDRVVLIVTSEFGRRVHDNDSSGTDHGAAGLAMAIGGNVIGGMYGQRPSLRNLTRQGNMNPTVDFRQVHATVLDDWLKADSNQVLNASMQTLGFLRAPGTPVPADGGGAPVVVTDPTERRSQFIRLYLAYFRRMPDAPGLNYWLTVKNGTIPLAEASFYFATSTEFVNTYGNVNDREFIELIYRNVLNREYDQGGLDYWTGVLADGRERAELMIWFSESEENIRETTPKVEEYNRTG